jgi:16S rRNA (cytidine1402-2'-O)-methyltransferase
VKSKTNTGCLYLIPNTLGGPLTEFVTPRLKEVVQQIDYYFIEEIKSARRLLRSLEYVKPFEEETFFMLNEHTRENQLSEAILPLLEGKNAGIISEAGVPCVADPGSAIVKLAHQFQIKVVPLSGPSSILLALMASGLNGQNFAFSGYLPRDRSERIKKIKHLEQLAVSGQTQLFMEAPYRNQQVFQDVVAGCRESTLLCIAKNIQCETEKILTQTIGEWQNVDPHLHKEVTMFALGKA